jgi:hypothetical protein
MIAPCHIDPHGVYDDGAVVLALDISTATLAHARRVGRLRYTRQGRRVLYLGQWLLEWLAADAPASARREEVSRG